MKSFSLLASIALLASMLGMAACATNTSSDPDIRRGRSMQDGDSGSSDSSGGGSGSDSGSGGSGGGGSGGSGGSD